MCIGLDGINGKNCKDLILLIEYNGNIIQALHFIYLTYPNQIFYPFF